RAEDIAQVRRGRFYLAQALEELERIAQAVDRQNRDALAHHRSLGCVLARQYDAREFSMAREDRGRQRTLDPLDPAVERKLAEHQILAEQVGLERARGGQQRERDRKVERRALLAGVGGREINR